jgi:hypothetical protein
MADENEGKSVDCAPHTPVRPLRFVKDKDGNGWLCDKDVDVNRDLRKQGCWRCEDMAFPDGGR